MPTTYAYEADVMLTNEFILFLRVCQLKYMFLNIICFCTLLHKIIAQFLREKSRNCFGITSSSEESFARNGNRCSDSHR